MSLSINSITTTSGKYVKLIRLVLRKSSQKCIHIKKKHLKNLY